MRLIDADALKEVFANLIPWCIDTPEELAFTNGLSSAYEATKNAPTIDAVSVVRCKDCKCWTEWDNGTGSCSRFALDWIGTDADDFCSMGERKDDESERN